MIVTRDEAFEDLLLDEMVEAYKEDRSGQHPSISDLVKCVTKSWYDMRSGGAVHSRQTKLFFAIGIATEHALLAGRREQTAAGEHEGIWYHIDNLQGVDAIVELKTTRKSMKGYEENIPSAHLKQIKGYLKTQGMLKVKYAVVFLIPAEIIAWELEFTQEEVDEQWAWFQERKDAYNQAVAEDVAPEAFKWNEDWECKGCSYKMLCDANSNMKGVSF